MYDIVIGRDAADKEKFGDKGLIYLGKGFVRMGAYTSLSNKLWMDIARSHVVLVAGKRGSGKCLHGDTLITLADGSQIPIKDIEKNREKVQSLNPQLKIEHTEKSDFFSRTVNKLLKIKLRSGKEIKLTPEHPLLTLAGWKETKSLAIGSRIATPRVMPAFGNNDMPDYEIKLLAYLLAEGHTKKIVLFANADEKIVQEFRESLSLFDNTLKLIKDKENHYRISSPLWKNVVLDTSQVRFNHEKRSFDKGSKIVLQKRSIRRLIEREEMFGLLSKEKYTSQKILQLKKEKMAMFISRLFSCDGSIYYKKTNNGGMWQISYCSASEKLIRQVQHILLRFGILSRLREKFPKLNGKTFHAFELILSGENVIKFIEQIGFFGIKEERQKKAIEDYKKKKYNPNVDTVPAEVWNMYKPENWAAVGRALGYKHPKAMRERMFYAPLRSTLLQIAQVEQSGPLQLLAQSDIFWDEIVGMELLEGEFTVYDICVPGNHNFVANDIIVHNSYTLSAIAEELSCLPPDNAKNIASLIFDTMGIFWTMKYPNEKDRELLDAWDLKAKSLPVKVFVPFGKAAEYKTRGIPVDFTFALQPSELAAEDWISLFNVDITSLPGVLMTRAIARLQEKQLPFTLNDIHHALEQDTDASPETKQIVAALFTAASSWGIFATSHEGTTVHDLLTAGTTTVLDISAYSSAAAFNIRALVISLLCRKIFYHRLNARKQEELESIRFGQDYLAYGTKRREPLVWIFIDEAHEFLKRDEKTPATDALVQLLREGRQPGISLVLATQQPGQIHRDAMSQSDIVLAHRVTSKADLEALNEIMQSYVLESIRQHMDSLPPLKGSAIILDDNSERIYPMRVRPRFTWHGGESPSSIQAEVKI